jgi:hypothetical protein
MRQKWHNSPEKPEKPVETGQFQLTKRLERLKVVLGTVVGTRINKGDFRIRTALPHLPWVTPRAGKPSTASTSEPETPEAQIELKEHYKWQKE